MLAQFFIGEQFHHFDFFIMSPGWSYLNGQLPYVHTISQYGVGVVAILAQLSKIAGGFDYLPILKMIIVFGIGYYFLVYGFLRWWLKSVPLALAPTTVNGKLALGVTIRASGFAPERAEAIVAALLRRLAGL